MSEIKNCPFCSSNKLKVEKKKRSTRYHINGNLDNYTASVRCNVCHARGPAVSGWVRNRRFVNENEWLPDEMYVEELGHLAIEAWNSRKPIKDMVEQLEQCMEDIAGYIDDDIFLGEHRAYKAAIGIVSGGRE